MHACTLVDLILYVPTTPRQRFLAPGTPGAGVPGARPVFSPLLLQDCVIRSALADLSLPVCGDKVADEFRPAGAVSCAPMIKTDCVGLIYA